MDGNTDRRTSAQLLSYKLTWQAFGSGELKRKTNTFSVDLTRNANFDMHIFSRVSFILQISNPCMNNFFCEKHTVKSDTLLAPSIMSIWASEKRGIYSRGGTYYRHVSFVLFFGVDAYVEGQQLRSCRDGQYPIHPVPGQASPRQVTST